VTFVLVGMKTLTHVQSWTGLVFFAFLGVHLATQVAGVFGAQTYDAVQSTVRSVYQSPLVEVPVMLALVAHAALAVVQVVRRRGLRPGARWHSVTGLFLLVFFVGHVAATRGPSLFYGVAPAFDGLAFTLRWVPAYFWPYYLLLGVAGAVHVALGLRGAVAMVSPRLATQVVRARLPVVVGVALSLTSVLGVLAVGGVFFDVGAPEQSQYAALLRRLGVAAETP
jgi:succinate dehydrogenase/fumarate reductase cytochrome b subunit